MHFLRIKNNALMRRPSRPAQEKERVVKIQQSSKHICDSVPWVHKWQLAFGLARRRGRSMKQLYQAWLYGRWPRAWRGWRTPPR